MLTVVEDGSTTSPTLLGRLRQKPGDQAAWNAFVERYGRKAYAWARRWGMQEADARDLTQVVLLDVVRQMTSFEYRPTGSFRSWLKTLAHRTWCDHLRSRKHAPTGNPDLIDTVASPKAGEDFVRQLEEESDREILEWAMARVRLRVRPHNWQAFVLTAIEERSGAEVAATLGMQIGAVYVARGKIQRMIAQEVRNAEQLEDARTPNSGGP